MPKKLHYIVIITFFYLSLLTNAQDNSKYSLSAVNYNLNVNAPLTDKEKKQLQEVYGEKLQEYIIDRPQRVKDIKNILRNRVFIIEIPNYKKEYKLLSQVPLFNNYNKEIQKKRFDKNTFNPLEYNFDFYSKETKVYRVDLTNYYIIIKSQYQQ